MNSKKERCDQPPGLYRQALSLSESDEDLLPGNRSIDDWSPSRSKQDAMATRKAARWPL